MKPAARLAALVCLAAFCGCVRAGRVLSPQGFAPDLQWTAEEKAQPLAIRTLGKTDEASFHRVRLSGSETPHTHDTHDATVFILKGKTIFHWEDHDFALRPGDVVEIPRGTVHWAENAGAVPTEAYVVFNPPYDGKDRREIARCP